MRLTMAIIPRARRFRSLSSAYLAQSPPLSAVWQSPQLIPRDAEKNPIVDMNSSAGIPFSTCTFLNTCSAGLMSARVCPRATATLSTDVNRYAIKLRFICDVYLLLLPLEPGSPSFLLYRAVSDGEHSISMMSKPRGCSLNDNLSRATQGLV